MICKNCGHLLNDGDRFCPNCGARVVMEVPDAKEKPSTLDALVSGLNRTTEKREGPVEKPQQVEEAASEEDTKPRHHFQFEEFNWNLDGYPTEDTKRTEDIDFNWESVVDEREKSRAAETDSDQELLKDKIKSENSGKDEREQSSGEEKTAEEAHEQELEEMIFGTKDREGNISDTTRLDEVEDLDDLSKTTRIDKFYTYNKKNEEFQELLDKEYNRLKAQIEADAARDHEAEAEKTEADGKGAAATDAEATKAEPADSPEPSETETTKESSGDISETPAWFGGSGQPEGTEASSEEESSEFPKEEQEAEPVTLRSDVPSGEGFEKEIESDIPEYINSLDAGNLSLAELLKAQTRQEEESWTEPADSVMADIPSDSLFSIPNEEKVDELLDRTPAAAAAPAAESSAEPSGSAFGTSAEPEYKEPAAPLFGTQTESVRESAAESAYEGPTAFGYDAPTGSGSTAEQEQQSGDEFEIPAFMRNSGSGEPLNVIEDLPTEPAAGYYEPPQQDVSQQYQQPSGMPQQEMPQQYQQPSGMPQQEMPQQYQQQPDMTQQEMPQPTQQQVQYLGVALAHPPKGIVAEPSEMKAHSTAEPITGNAGFVPPVQHAPQQETAGTRMKSPEATAQQGYPGAPSADEGTNSQSIEQMIREDEANGREQADNRITFQDVFKDEIQAEKEDNKKKPKKHTGLKILAIILCVLIVLEIIVICIKTFAPDSAASVALQDLFNAVYGRLSSLFG